MPSILIILLTILITLLSYITAKAWKVTKYWKNKNVPHIKPYLFFGNAIKSFFRQVYIHETHLDVCHKYPNEPVVGFYEYTQPRWVVKDVDYAEAILIKDFVHFVDRGFPVDDSDPINTNIALMTGKKWRAFRNKLSPMFTSGKMRSMFDDIKLVGDRMIKVINDFNENEGIELKDIMSGFTMDVIACSAFGMDADSLTNAHTEFRRMAKKVTTLDTWLLIKYIIITNIPWLPKLIGINFNKNTFIEYFAGIVRNSLNHRRKTKSYRNDFIQMMIQLLEKGFVEIQTKDETDDYLGIDNDNYKTESFEISEDLLIGLSIVFVQAGLEGTTNSMQYSLYEIAKDERVQNKIREEVLKTVKKNDGLTFEAVREMTYLEQCIKEALRLHPAAQAVFRVCTKDYTLPNGMKIEKGESLMISNKWIQFDPNIFPEPEKFIPERFDPEQNTYPICAWMPFGQGPRMCIGFRFVMMEMKYFFAKLLMTYEIKLDPKTKEPLIDDPYKTTSTPKTPIYFNIRKLSI